MTLFERVFGGNDYNYARTVAAIDEAIQEASTQMGVEFVNDVDKDAFRQATSGMINEYCAQYPGVKELLDIIDSVE